MQGVTGITGAGYIWHQVVEKAIELGYIEERNIPVPDGIVRDTYCLDTNCFRKENIYVKQGEEFYSRPIDAQYSEQDIFENLNDLEQERLRELEIRLH